MGQDEGLHYVVMHYLLETLEGRLRKVDFRSLTRRVLLEECEDLGVSREGQRTESAK